MLLGFGYLYKFVMFYFLFLFEKQKIIDKKKTVGQKFVILFFCFWLKSDQSGP